HGVGFQGHLAIQFGFPSDLADNFRRFAAAGMDVALTEVDVRMQLPVTPEKQATQAQFYRDTFAACAQVRRCVGYTVWGYTDRHSWIPGFFEGEGSACLFDENLVPKPAYEALLEVRR
ncbi:MAG: endo-1,4-beta-xylanase, partial [Actinomadura sp.]